MALEVTSAHSIGVDKGKRAVKKFGRRVRELRVARHWTQEELAFALEVDRSYVSSLENGQRNPTLKTIAYVANAFDMTIAELCDGI